MAGAGKSEACNYLAQKGYPVLRFGDETDRGLKERGLSLTEENERCYREELRQQLGMAAYAQKIEPRIREAFHPGVECIVLDGLYSWEEYLYLKKRFPGLKLLAVYTRPELRYRRLSRRQTRPLPPQQARQRDHDELQQLNKAGPIALADYLVTNNRTLASLHRQLDQLA